MPNIKSAIKRVKVAKTKTMKNVIRKSALKTSIKKCKVAINTGTDVNATFNNTVKAIDQAAAKGLMHKNTASRKKSRLAKAINRANQ